MNQNETLKPPQVGQSELNDGLGAFSRCEHPDHNDSESCLDRAVGCSKHCFCCMGEMAIPAPNAEMPTLRAGTARNYSRKTGV